MTNFRQWTAAICLALLFATGATAQSGRVKETAAERERKLERAAERELREAKPEPLSDETKKELQYAIELYFKRWHEEAETILTEIVESDARNRRAWLYLGLIYAQTRREESAEKAFAIYEKLPPGKSAESGVTPAEVTFLPQPEYPERARREMITGTVKLAVEFGADGNVGFVCPVTTFDSNLTNAAIKAARGVKFKPARDKDDKPISTVKVLLFEFGVGRRD